MNWKNILLIFMREVRDQVRDRRTLMMVAVLPLLLYPALGIGLMQVMVSVARQKQSVMIVNGKEMPSPDFVDFLQSPDLDPIEVFHSEETTEVDDDIAAFAEQVRDHQSAIQQLAQTQHELDSADEGKVSELESRLSELKSKIEEWFRDAPVDVLLVVPEGFKESYKAGNSAMAQGKPAEYVPQPIVFHNSAKDKSELAFARVLRSLQDWESALLARRLDEAMLDSALMKPVPFVDVDLAKAEEIAANLWSKLFPALLVLFSVTGALYPAIDLGAGEKERGTMETLLISPATRTEIVIGKFLTVMLFSYATALLNLASMGITSQKILSAVGSVKDSPLGDLSLPPLTSVFWVLVFAVPICALFSALSLALAMFAKSSKEGQYYLMPLMLVAMGLTVFCMFPGVDLSTPYYILLPVIAPSLLLKALLLDTIFSPIVMFNAMPVLCSSFLYCGLALWWAIDQFRSEDILFREAERFDPALWLRHLMREKEETPSFAEAAVCFVVIAFMQFLFLTSMQGSTSMFDSPRAMVTTQLIYLIATVGLPPVIMGLVLTKNWWKSLKLRLPPWRYLAAGFVLPLTLQPVVLEMLNQLEGFFPPMPEGAAQLMEAMGTDSVPLWLALAAFALAPAICEELAFRGYILTGLQNSRHRWLPIFISAILFGVIHLIPKQVFNAALLGLVLGLLAVRSKSLLPGVIFHAIFNGTQVLATRLDETHLETQLARWLVSVDMSQGVPIMHFRLPVLVISGLSSALIVGWMIAAHRREYPRDLSSQKRRELFD